jgi:hypothetical protein
MSSIPRQSPSVHRGASAGAADGGGGVVLTWRAEVSGGESRRGGEARGGGGAESGGREEERFRSGDRPKFIVSKRVA